MSQRNIYLNFRSPEDQSVTTDVNPSPLFCPPLTAANLSYRVTSFSPSLPEALRTSYQSHPVPHSDTPSLAKACTPPDSYLLLSFPLCQSSEPTLVSGLIRDPHRTDVRAIIHLKLQFFLLVLHLLSVLLIQSYHSNPTPTAHPHPFSRSTHLALGTRLLFF